MKKSKSNQHLLFYQFKSQNLVRDLSLNSDRLPASTTEPERIEYCWRHLTKLPGLAEGDLEKMLAYGAYMHDAYPRAKFHFSASGAFFDGLSEIEVEECCLLDSSFEHMEVKR